MPDAPLTPMQTLLSKSDIIVSADDPVVNPADNPFDDPPRSIEWDVTLNFDEPGGANDWNIFGEAPDANDGPPVDIYDEPKPPAPMTPYIRAWFMNGLPPPYTLLLKDYREYPDTNKVWDLYVKWIPVDYVTPTDVTILWNTAEFVGCEYSSVELHKKIGPTYYFVSDMLINTSYTIIDCPADTTQFFRIICVANQSPVAVNDTATTPEDTAVDINVTTNDYDPDGSIDVTTVTVVGGP